MTESQDLAAFVEAAKLNDASPEAVEQLKIRVLDTVGVAIGALDAEPIVAIRGLLEDLGGTEQSTLIGGGKTSPERAAFFNSALSRYLDFMDAYLAKGETNHPSDNFGAVLAAAESVGASGKTCSPHSPWPTRYTPDFQMSHQFAPKVSITPPKEHSQRAHLLPRHWVCQLIKSPTHWPSQEQPMLHFVSLALET